MLAANGWKRAMYISKIAIQNYRNFHNSEIHFNNGVNVVIGPNNSGKSNLIRAIGLLLDTSGRKTLGVDDFHKSIPLEVLKAAPPQIQIELTISQAGADDNDPDDLATVANWLTRLESPYEARLTYIFSLQERERDNYIEAVALAVDHPTIWNVLERDYLRLYTSKVLCGDVANQTSVDSESLQKFDFQFLDAIRDVERDMLTGKNTMLRDVLNFFLDYNIKNSDATPDEKKGQIEAKRVEFSQKATELIDHLQERMAEGKGQILSYAHQTGASFNQASPDFEGTISDVDIYSALKLIVKYEAGIDIKIPATHNGLGYNNLIFMSLLLAKMQVNSNGSYLGTNAKVFPVLAIEEPEAHLHPSMQHKFLKFLKQNMNESERVRQIFVTTHSTHITAAVSLDEIICLHEIGGTLRIGYPGRCFPDNEAGRKAKAYVQRFLDATRSDMLFAQKVILVEGLAEQILISVLAELLDEGQPLEDSHVAVIAVGGRYFENFLYLFDQNGESTVPKKIACITDRDPCRKHVRKDKYEACYPFEKGVDADYEYKDHAQEYLDLYEHHPNIRFFSQDGTKGKTFEFDLVLSNPSLELLLTDSIANRAELEGLMENSAPEVSFDDLAAGLSGTDKNQKIIDGLRATVGWSETDKKNSLIAARYLNSISKGENALELAFRLRQNAESAEPKVFVVPQYIQDCVTWICQ